MKSRHINHLSSIADNYDAFILDVFGIVHEGGAIIASAQDIISQLAANKKQVLFLSNSPHRAKIVEEHLKKLGIERSNFHGVLTAGELTYRFLEKNAERPLKTPCRLCYLIGAKDLKSIVPNKAYQFTKDIDAADFILAAGPESNDHTIEFYEAVLKRAAHRSLPMICSNPDLQVISEGKYEIRAGKIAMLYQQLGGVVYFQGKPHPSIYERAQQMLGNINKGRILVIGDSIVTDIVGAKSAQLDSLLAVSQTTLFEIGQKEMSCANSDLLEGLYQLRNNLYLPTFFSNPLKW